MGNDRLYTEKEISKIIKKAGEIQASEREKVTMGLSLEEIQQLAEDFGLEADIIASVAEDIDIEPEEEENTGFFSSLLTPTKLDMEQIIPGNLTEEEWPEIVSLIERAVSKSGNSSQVGKMLEWSSDSKQSAHKLSVIPGDNQTKVIFHSNFSQLALAWNMSILVNVAVWAFILTMINFGLIGIPIGIAITFATYLVILSGFKSFIKKKRNSIKSAFSRMKALVREKKSSTKKAEKVTSTAKISFPEEEIKESADEISIKKKVR